MRLSELTKSLDRSQFSCGNAALDDYFHGETPDRNALEIRPEAETPLWDLREHLHEFVSELEVLRPAFKDMPEFQKLEQEVNVVKQTLSFLLNC